MGMVDVLRKLGIFRSGAQTQTYRDATERSAVFQNDGVLDEKKDFLIDKTRKPMKPVKR